MTETKDLADSYLLGSCGGRLVDVLADTGAEDSFVDFAFCRDSGIKMFRLPCPISLSLLDGEAPLSGRIEFFANVTLVVQNKEFTERCLVTWLAITNPVVLGVPWFRRELPTVLAAIREYGTGESHKSPQKLNVPVPASAVSANAATAHEAKTVTEPLLRVLGGDFTSQQDTPVSRAEPAQAPPPRPDGSSSRAARSTTPTMPRRSPTRPSASSTGNLRPDHRLPPRHTLCPRRTGPKKRSRSPKVN